MISNKLGTFIFIICGVILNLTLMTIFVFGLSNLSTSIIKGLGYELKNPALNILLTFSMIIGLGLSFFVYSKLIKLIQKKFDYEQYIHPLFRKGSNRF